MFTSTRWATQATCSVFPQSVIFEILSKKASSLQGAPMKARTASFIVWQLLTHHLRVFKWLQFWTIASISFSLMMCFHLKLCNNIDLVNFSAGPHNTLVLLQKHKDAHNKHVYLWLFHLSISGLPVNHTKGDALGLWGEHPADRWPTVSHRNCYHTVTAGLDEEFPGPIAKLRNIINAERDSHPAMKANSFQACYKHTRQHIEYVKVKTHVTSPDLRRLISESWTVGTCSSGSSGVTSPAPLQNPDRQREWHFVFNTNTSSVA